MSRSAPAEIRLPMEALLGFSWARAAHLAIVDAVEYGWDTPHRWVAALAKISTARAGQAAKENLRAGIYDGARTVTKTTRDGTRIESTVYQVNRDWTTRGRSKLRKVYVRLDKRFLAANPRANDPTKRVYHFLAFEQWRSGACALTPSAIAVSLRVEPTASQTAAERVYAALRSLRRRGEAIARPTDTSRCRATSMRRRMCLASTLSGGAPRMRRNVGPICRSEPAPPSARTSSPVTQNHPTTLERLGTTLRAERVERDGDTESVRGAAHGKTSSEREEVEAALPQAMDAVDLVLGYVPQPLVDDLATALAIHSADEPLNPTQTAILDRFLAQRLLRLGDLREKSPDERFGRPRRAIRTAVRHDDLLDQLKRTRSPFEVRGALAGIEILPAVETS